VDLPTLPPLPRLPLVPDVMRRCRVPRDLDSVTTIGTEEDPRAGGMTRRGVERIWAAVRGLYRGGVHPAIQICLRREGHVVLNRAIGHARGNGPNDRGREGRIPATPETPFVVFSASKAITAMLIHVLSERGLLDISHPVCEYIPEYARHGKDGITIGHVLAHRAGVPNLPRAALDLDLLDDVDHIVEIVCDAKPRSRPGHRLAYHAVSGGFILGEIVRRVTGHGIRDVLAKEILRPLNFRWTNYGVDPNDIELVGHSYVTGLPPGPALSALLTRALGVPVPEVVKRSNDPRFLTGVIPSANIVTTANELSRFFELGRQGGELDGVRIFEPPTLLRALEEQSYLEVDFTLGFPTRFSYGFMLGARLLSLFGPNTEMAFGHLGFVNILGWADPERALSCALITSGKPIIYPELMHFLNFGIRVGAEAPKLKRPLPMFEGD
jgi:CubicO group peptidase (beta-lactamase class C family)